jgi:hypothetical protein
MFLSVLNPCVFTMPIGPTSQDAEMPFPWGRSAKSKPMAPGKPNEQVDVVGTGEQHTACKLRTVYCRSPGSVDLTGQPWYDDLVCPCKMLGCISFQVPRFGSSAGSVVKHCQEALQSIFGKHDPCIFKIGWTHNAAFRWDNPIYGYRKDADRWSHMTVLYISDEPISPAFVEAFLIDQHISD